jgi:hypothetical protein
MYCRVAKASKAPYKKSKFEKSSLDRKVDRKSLNKRKLTKSKKQLSNHSINLSQYNKYSPGEFISVDLKHMPTSINGENYMCTFTCVGTRLSETVHLSTKLASEFLPHYTAFCKYIRNKTGRYPKYLHTDNGGEFVNEITKNFNKQN